MALLDAQVSALGLGAAVGGVKLLVPGWDVERASEILAAPVAGSIEELHPALTPPHGVAAVGTAPPGHAAAGRAAADAGPSPNSPRLALWTALLAALLAGLALLR